MKGMRVISVALLVLCVAVVGMLIFAKGEDVDDEPGRRITLPPLGGIADYQIGGAYPPDPEVEIVTRDRSQDPVDGVYSICYVNAFQVQPDELAQWERDRPDLVLRGRDGAVVIDADWDEALVDTSSAAARERLMSEVIGPWLTDCASRGFDAVEPDNLDSFTVAAARSLVATTWRSPRSSPPRPMTSGWPWRRRTLLSSPQPRYERSASTSRSPRTAAATPGARAPSATATARSMAGA